MLDGALKSFRGRNVAEAMEKVRAELGRDAFVIEKRELRAKKSLFKLGGEEVVEIIAASSEDYARMQTPQSQANAPRRGTLLEKTYGTASAAPGFAGGMPGTGGLSGALRSSPELAAENPAGAGEGVRLQINRPVSATNREPSMLPDEFARGAGGAQPTAIRREAPAPSVRAAPVPQGDYGAFMAGMREEMLKLVSLQARGGFPAVGENLLDAYQMLIENEVNAGVARQLVEDLQREMGQATLERVAVSAGLERALERRFRVGGGVMAQRRGDRPSVVALVGPSGGGKTTTIVKIAFDAAYNQKKKVGIINEDFSRPGAMAQLQGLIQILDLPLVTAETPQCMADRIRSMGGLDLVLIDTAGRSPRDTAGIAELEKMLEAAHPDEVHLAVPGCSTERAAVSLTQSFRGCGFQKIILSKLDEAPNYGLALNLAMAASEPISYLTVGQKWSGGLCAAQPGQLARLVLGLEALPTS